MSLIEKRNFIITATTGMLLMWTYFGSLDFIGDSRMIDHKLTYDEMYWWEGLIMLQGMMLTFVVYFSSIFHSFGKNKKKWGFLIILIWPLAFIYAWREGGKIREENEAC